MAQTSAHYYARLTAGIDPNDVQQWEQQMAAAERRRIYDKTVMDIIGSVKISNAPLPEADSAANIGDARSLDWLQLALEIEEKQYGITSSLPG
jgi:hypothetical protein